MIDPSCSHVANTLEWGYRYRKSASGLAAMAVEKNHWSHIGDAVQYLALHYNIQVEGSLYRRNNTARPVPRRDDAYT